MDKNKKGFFQKIKYLFVRNKIDDDEFATPGENVHVLTASEIRASQDKTADSKVAEQESEERQENSKSEESKPASEKKSDEPRKFAPLQPPRPVSSGNEPKPFPAPKFVTTGDESAPIYYGYSGESVFVKVSPAKKKDFIRPFKEMEIIESAYDKFAGKVFTTNSFFVPSGTETVFVEQDEILGLNERFLENTSPADIAIKVDYNKELTSEQIKKIRALEEKLQDGGRRIYFAETTLEITKPAFNKYSVASVISANEKLSGWTKKIESARVNGEKLSPLEKYMAAYDTVTNFMFYKLQNESDPNAKSRQISSILNTEKNDTICCVGFAKLLAALSNRLGIPSFAIPEVSHKFYDDYDRENPRINHATARVYIKDSKYNIDGIFCADPSADSSSSKDYSTMIMFSLSSYDDYKKAGDVERKLFTAEKILAGEIAPKDYFKNRGFVLETTETKDKLNFYKNVGIMPTEDEVTKELGEVDNLMDYAKLLQVIMAMQTDMAGSSEINSLNKEEFGDINPEIFELYKLLGASNKGNLLQEEYMNIFVNPEHFQSVYRELNRKYALAKLLAEGWQSKTKAVAPANDIMTAYIKSQFAVNGKSASNTKMAIVLASSQSIPEMIALSMMNDKEDSSMKLVTCKKLEEIVYPMLDSYNQAENAIEAKERYKAITKTILDYLKTAKGEDLPKFASKEVVAMFSKFNETAIDENCVVKSSDDNLLDILRAVNKIESNEFGSGANQKN